MMLCTCLGGGGGGGEGGGGAGIGVAELEAELRRLVVDGREGDVTFDEFRYYLRLVRRG